LSHSALGFKTPEEMFSGKKPKVSHLKIFGCPVFVHIPKEKRNKLDPSRKKGIFVRYCEVSKAFRVYIPSHHHIEISRDVTFDEDAALKKSRRCQLEEVYEEEPVAPRVAEPVREEIASPDEEILEDHDIRISRTSPDDDLPQEKASLGKGTHSRWREVWCPRRNHETSKET
jgi:hypothetical protein